MISTAQLQQKSRKYLRKLLLKFGAADIGSTRMYDVNDLSRHMSQTHHSNERLLTNCFLASKELRMNFLVRICTGCCFSPAILSCGAKDGHETRELNLS